MNQLSDRGPPRTSASTRCARANRRGFYSGFRQLTASGVAVTTGSVSSADLKHMCASRCSGHARPCRHTGCMRVCAAKRAHGDGAQGGGEGGELTHLRSASASLTSTPSVARALCTRLRAEVKTLDVGGGAGVERLPLGQLSFVERPLL